MRRMKRGVNTAEYRALADIRFLIRLYLNHTERAVREAGLEPQQYMGMLQLRGLPAEQQPTIRALAERLQLRHNSVVELVNRMESRGLFRRERAESDRRCVLVRITPKGEELLNRLVQNRIAELRVTGRDLVKSLGVVLGTLPRKRNSHASSNRKRSPTKS